MLANLGKHKIAVETGNIADGDSLAAYLTSASGALVTSETIGAHEHAHVKTAAEFAEGVAAQAGDHVAVAGGINASGDYQAIALTDAGEVKITGSITVTEVDVYAEDTPHVSGDMGTFGLAVRRDARTSGTSTDGDYASFNVNASGEMWVKDADALAELLDQGTTLDSILADTATIDSNTASILGHAVTIDTNIAAILADTATIDSNLASLVKAEDAAHVSGDAGIQALAVRKDASGSNAADGDYTSLQTWSEGSLKTVNVANASILQQQVAVTGTAAALPTSALSNRRQLVVQNAGSASIWIGSATVTASGATAGLEVPKGGFIALDAGPAVSVYAVSAGGSVAANVLQMA